MSEAIDFTVTDYVQRLSAWAAFGARNGANNDAVTRMAAAYSAAVFVPICGKAVQKRGTVGFEPDGWMLQQGEFRFHALADLKRVMLSGWLPPEHRADVTITVTCGDVTVTQLLVPGQLFVLDFPLGVSAQTEHAVQVKLSTAFRPSESPGSNGDTRRLGCIFQAIEFQ